MKMFVLFYQNRQGEDYNLGIVQGNSIGEAARSLGARITEKFSDDQACIMLRRKALEAMPIPIDLLREAIRAFELDSLYTPDYIECTLWELPVLPSKISHHKAK